MTRILSYNILVGATRRVDPLTRMIQAAQPDVVGLVEATNPRVIEELARRLDMQQVMPSVAARCGNLFVSWRQRGERRTSSWGISIRLHLAMHSKPVLFYVILCR